MFLLFIYLIIFIHSCSKIAYLSVHRVRLALQQNFLKGENMYSIYRCAVLAGFAEVYYLWEVSVTLL